MPRLVVALLRCSLAEAERLVGGEVGLPEDDGLGASLRVKMGGEFDASPSGAAPEFPKEFRPLGNGSVFAKPFVSYLKGRGYRATQVAWLTETYNLQYVTQGKFAYRIVVPIYDRWGELQTWTARAIRADEEIRYKTLSRVQSLRPPTETLLGLPLLWNCNNPRVLLVCEGPFDAFWVTTLGRTLGVYATCLFGLSLSSLQMELLLGLQERFAYVALLLDSAAGFQTFKLAQSGLNLGVERLPDNVKDPAELPAGMVVEFCASLLD